MGVRVVDEAAAPDGLRRIELRDFDYDAIVAALRAFGVEPELDAIAVAVFDHGAAPPDVSDRALPLRVHRRDGRPERPRRVRLLPRRRCPRSSPAWRPSRRRRPPRVPLLVMDTGPAAVLGALEDARVRQRRASALVANLGNFHTLAFHVVGGRVLGLFEHHTGELSAERLEELPARARRRHDLQRRRSSPTRGTARWSSSVARAPPELLAVVGPRRNMLAGSALRPYFAVPHGDMMLAGCFGLPARARPQAARLAPEIERRAGRSVGLTPSRRCLPMEAASSSQPSGR